MDSIRNLDSTRRAKETGGVHDEINKLTDRLLEEAKKQAVATVDLPGWGTFYKLPSGIWRGPGGNYGVGSVLGTLLEETLAKQAGA